MQRPFPKRGKCPFGCNGNVTAVVSNDFRSPNPRLNDGAKEFDEVAGEGVPHRRPVRVFNKNLYGKDIVENEGIENNGAPLPPVIFAVCDRIF